MICSIDQELSPLLKLTLSAFKHEMCQSHVFLGQGLAYFDQKGMK